MATQSELGPRNRRLPAEVYRQLDRPVFVTIRGYERLVPFRSPAFNTTVIDILSAERFRSGCSVYAYCLMPDHLHLLVAPKEEGSCVLHLIDRFKGRSTTASWAFGTRGRLWQPRSYDHVLKRDQAVEPICRYILENPVRSNMVARAEQYPWSGQMDPIPQII